MISTTKMSRRGKKPYICWGIIEGYACMQTSHQPHAFYGYAVIAYSTFFYHWQLTFFISITVLLN